MMGKFTGLSPTNLMVKTMVSGSDFPLNQSSDSMIEHYSPQT
jgi:hypothetical protein